MAVERIQEFIEVLKQARSEETIKGLCKDELAYLDEHFSMLSKRTSTTRYRNAIRELDPKHIALDHFRFPYHDRVSYKASYRKQIAKELKNKKPLNAAEMVARAEKLLASDSYLALSLGLMLLSGRRVTEILKTANFKKIDDCFLLFSGQLKTRDAENAKTAPYVIPVLTDADKFLDAFAKLRKMKDFSSMSNYDVIHSTAPNLSALVKKHFYAVVPGINTKALRAAYVTIAIDMFKPVEQDEDSFIAEVLGHAENDMDTAKAYKDFYIVDPG